MQYEQSEGPTKVDLGDSDHTVILREEDISNGIKFSGWTNPLGWTDDGQDDEYVLWFSDLYSFVQVKSNFI